jgi:hypothetical protein
MAKFDLKKAILENKATFFGSLNEGQFSWMTQDTGQQIGSEDENRIPVYMFDDKGNFYYENSYDGYGDFGGMDYYSLLDKMNGGRGDRGRGIDLAFGNEKVASRVLFPALVTKPDMFNYKTHDFTKEAESDPNQSWYAPEEEEDFIDQNDEKVYGYDDEDEEELEEGYDDQFYAPDHLEQTYGEEMASKIEAEIEDMGPNAWDRFTGMESAEEVEEYISDIKDMMDLNEGKVEEAYNSYTFKVAKNFAKYMSKKEGRDFEVTMNSVDEYSFDLDLDGEPYAGGSYLIQNGNIHNVAIPGNPIYATTDDMEDYIGEGYDEFKRVDKGSKGVTAKNTGEKEVYGAGVKKGEEIEKKKMKKSKLKAKIKEMVLAEMNMNEDTFAPTSLTDFLAEIEEMLNEAEGLTPLQDYIYQYEIEISGEDRAQEFLDDIRKLNTPQDVYDYYAYDRDWSGSMDDDLENIYRQVKRKFKNLNEAEGDKHVVMKGNKFYTGTEFVDDMEDAMKYNLKSATEIAKEKKGMVYTPKAVKEAKKDEEVEDEVDIDIESPEAMDAPMGGINVTQNADADLTGDKKDVQDNLEAALEAAKALGDDKLATQIGNSLTFFTKQHVVKEDLKETLLLQKRAGIITETQYKQKLNEVEKMDKSEFLKDKPDWLKDIYASEDNQDEENEVPLTPKVKKFITKTITDSKADGSFKDLIEADWFENELIDELINLFPDKDYDSASSEVMDYISQAIK